MHEWNISQVLWIGTECSKQTWKKLRREREGLGGESHWLSEFANGKNNWLESLCFRGFSSFCCFILFTSWQVDSERSSSWSFLFAGNKRHNSRIFTTIEIKIEMNCVCMRQISCNWAMVFFCYVSFLFIFFPLNLKFYPKFRILFLLLFLLICEYVLFVCFMICNAQKRAYDVIVANVRLEHFWIKMTKNLILGHNSTRSSSLFCLVLFCLASSVPLMADNQTVNHLLSLFGES